MDGCLEGWLDRREGLDLGMERGWMKKWFNERMEGRKVADKRRN
jgi:hypothetical protein